MSFIKKSFLIALLVLVVLMDSAYAQYTSSTGLNYQVKKVYPYLSMNRTTLAQAERLSDIRNIPNDRNLSFDPSWVKEYMTVEVHTVYQGVLRSAFGKNDRLTPEQKKNIMAADAGTDISVRVKYIPENNLKDNDPKELNFTFSVDPDKDAQYPDGEEGLAHYLKEKAIELIPDGTFEGYDLTALKFTISEDGAVTNAHIVEDMYRDSNDPKVDAILLKAIQNMTCWIPAEYSDGTKSSQEYVLTVGNTENCVINVLNIE